MHKGIKTPVVSVVGRSKAGKTSLVEKIIEYLTSRGVMVAAIKHAFHPLKVEKSKDGERLFESGALWSGVVSDEGKTVLFGRIGLYEEALFTLISLLGETVDIFILEGFKKLPFKKIEVLNGSKPESKKEELLAVVGDGKPEGWEGIPFFTRDDIKGICSIIAEYAGLSLP